MKNITKKTIIIIFLVWTLILLLYFISFKYQVEINVSDSMPQTFWFTEIDNKNLKLNDYVLFKFHDRRMPKSSDFIYVVKQIGGVPGDKIISKKWIGIDSYPHWETNTILILPTGIYPVFNKLKNNKFTALTQQNLIIPKGCYFVHGNHQPTFDSRYKEFGLVCENQIYGKTHPIF